MTVTHTKQNCACDTANIRQSIGQNIRNKEKTLKELLLIFKCRRSNMRDSPRSRPYSVHEIIKAFNKHYKEQQNSRRSPSEQIFYHFPHLRQVVGYDEFIDNQEHIKFEKADLRNDIDVFIQLIFKDRLNCMLVHMKNTCFDWTNWRKFISDTNLDDIILEKCDVRTTFDEMVIHRWADDNLDDYF